MTAERPRTPTPTSAPTSTSVPKPQAETQPAPAPAAPPAPSAPSDWDRAQSELDKVWGKDWPQAIRLLEAFLERNPTHTEARGKLNSALVSEGDLLFQNGDRTGAVDRYSRAAALGMPDGTARAKLNALTPTPTSIPTPVPPPTVAPPTNAPAPKPQSGILGSANMSTWCRQVHNGNLYQSRASFPQTEGWYCSIVSMTAPTRDIPVDFNAVCRREYNNPRAIGRYLNNNVTWQDLECSVP